MLTSNQIKRKFILDCYDGNRKAYLEARKKDRCKVQIEWAIYVDTMCKNGLLTQEEYNRATF